jgi:GT2 family glycosyltransferase
MTPALSVVVPARDAAGTLPATLDSLRGLMSQGHEVIVVDDGSRDATAQIAEGYPCRLIRLERGLGPAAARNRGASAAQGEILWFVDADVVVRANAPRLLLEHFSRAGTHAVQGIYERSLPGDSPVTAYQNDYYSYVFRRAAGPATGICATFCFAIRRKLFLDLGGFDEAIREPTVEDEELGYRLLAEGFPILLDPDLQVRHLAVYTLAGFARRRSRMSRTQVRALLDRRFDAPARRLLARGRNTSHHPVPMLAGIPLSSLGWLGLIAALLRPTWAALMLPAAPWGLALLLNAPLLGFLGRGRPARTAHAAGMLLLDWTTLSIGFAVGLVDWLRRRIPGARDA